MCDYFNETPNSTAEQGQEPGRVDKGRRYDGDILSVVHFDAADRERLRKHRVPRVGRRGPGTFFFTPYNNVQ